MKQVFLVVTALFVLGSGCISQFTDCQSHTDCDPGYGCSPEDFRCHPSCRNGLCDDGLACRDTVCVEAVDGQSSSSSGSRVSSSRDITVESSSSPRSSSALQPSSLPQSSSAFTQSSSMPGQSSSSPGASSGAGQSSSMISGMSSSATSQMGGQQLDPCNGADDDHDGTTDEDTFRVVGQAIVLSTDSPPIRVAVASSDQGFFVAFSAYCLAESTTTDVYVNHVNLDGSLSWTSGPCDAVKGVRALRSTGTKSRHPGLASEGGRTAGLVWTEGNETSATLQMAEITLQPGNATPLAVAGPISAGAVDSSYEGGDVEVYGSIAAGNGAYLTALTRGEDTDEEALVQRIVRMGANLMVTANPTVGQSTGAEVAVAYTQGDFITAWMDLDDAQGRFVSPTGALLGSECAFDPGSDVVFELAAVGMGQDAILGWQEVTSTDFSGPRHVSLGYMAPTSASIDRIFRVQTPDGRGSYGLGHGLSDEVLLTSLDQASQRPVLRSIDGMTGDVCATLTLLTATDIGHMAVGASGQHLLVVYRKGADDEQASNSVEALLLERVTH